MRRSSKFNSFIFINPSYYAYEVSNSRNDTIDGENRRISYFWSSDSWSTKPLHDLTLKW